MLNLTRAEAETLDRALDALTATQPEDEWAPDLQVVRVKIWKAQDAEDARRSRRRLDDIVVPRTERRVR